MILPSGRWSLPLSLTDKMLLTHYQGNSLTMIGCYDTSELTAASTLTRCLPLSLEPPPEDFQCVKSLSAIKGLLLSIPCDLGKSSRMPYTSSAKKLEHL